MWRTSQSDIAGIEQSGLSTVTAEAAEAPPGDAAARVLELTNLIGTASAGQAEASSVVATFAARAEAARSGVAVLEQERAEVLLAGGDAAPLRGRLASARDDLDDCEMAERLARERLGTIEACSQAGRRAGHRGG